MDPGRHPELRAASPGAGAEALREAYLSLLARALCDLAGASTMSVDRRFGGGVFSRELAPEELEKRIAGRDWPLQALSMVGLRRLDDLRSCVEAVVRDGVRGDLVEAGCWRGGASILIRATLDSLGAEERTLYVADSFAGFPMPDPGAYPEDSGLEELSTHDFLATPIEEVRRNFARFGVERGVELVPGFFDETLPGLRGRTWALARLDGDTYEATKLALESLYPGLSVGGYLIVDDYMLVEECQRAVADFREAHGIEEPIEDVDGTGARWRRESGTPIEIAEPPQPHRRQAGTRVASRLPWVRVPTLPEIELEFQAGVLRHRLRLAKAEIDALRAGEEPPEPQPAPLDQAPRPRPEGS
jgi:O-methyltransferase